MVACDHVANVVTGKTGSMQRGNLVALVLDQVLIAHGTDSMALVVSHGDFLRL